MKQSSELSETKFRAECPKKEGIIQTPLTATAQVLPSLVIRVAHITSRSKTRQAQKHGSWDLDARTEPLSLNMRP